MVWQGILNCGLIVLGKLKNVRVLSNQCFPSTICR